MGLVLKSSGHYLMMDKLKIKKLRSVDHSDIQCDCGVIVIKAVPKSSGLFSQLYFVPEIRETLGFPFEEKQRLRF